MNFKGIFNCSLFRLDNLNFSGVYPSLDISRVYNEDEITSTDSGKMFINRKEKRVLSALLKLKTTKIKNHFRGMHHQQLVTNAADFTEREQTERDDEPLLEIDVDCADNFYQ